MATSHDRYLCKSFSRYTPRAFREHSLDCCIDGVRGADTWGKTLLNKGFATRAGAPWARLRSASRRRRIAHAGGAILAQDGSWRFFDRGGEGGDGRVLRDADRTVGLVCLKTCLQALKGGSATRWRCGERHGLCPVLFYGVAPRTGFGADRKTRI